MEIVTAREAFKGSSDVQVVSASPVWICLRIRADLSVRDRVVSFFRAHMATEVANELSEQLAIALDELLTNAIEHGGAERPQAGVVAVTYIRTSRSIVFHLRDGGPGFSLESVNHAAVNNPPGYPLLHAEHRSRLGLRPGGFGILLVKQIADELIYNEYGNEAILIKYL